LDRFYRDQFKTEGLFSWKLQIMESDLFIICDRDLKSQAKTALEKARRHIEEYIRRFPDFGESLQPVKVGDDAPGMVKNMSWSTTVYGVGPMAAVAGAVAREVGEALSPLCSHLIIENGGDIYLKSSEKITLAVYAGENSPFTGKLKFQGEPGGKPLGVCTSSGKVGHSLSFGRSDAVVTVAGRADIADAAATAIGNLVRTPRDIEPVINQEIKRKILSALIIVIDDKMGAWGEINLI
jgi:uncharacterized protein